MDIIKKIKPLKASFEKLSVFQKLGLFLILASLTTLIIPHQTSASAFGNENSSSPLVFVLGDQKEFIAAMNKQAQLDYQKRKLELELRRRRLLATKVQNYLENFNSPLASYSAQIVELKNWKKIIALANAESSLCRKYPVSKANCWGVGGAVLWDFGDNLAQGVKAMDKFLNSHPKNSRIKYSQMGFDKMNGLYKQPAATHWVENNEIVYQDLIAIEKSL